MDVKKNCSQDKSIPRDSNVQGSRLCVKPGSAAGRGWGTRRACPQHIHAHVCTCMHMVHTHTYAQAPFSGCPAPQALVRTLWLTPRSCFWPAAAGRPLAWASCLHSPQDGWIRLQTPHMREAAIPRPETLVTGSCGGLSHMPTLPLISCAHSCVQGMGSSYHCGLLQN